MGTTIPWFRYGLRTTKRWLQREQAAGSSDRFEAREALERCLRQRAAWETELPAVLAGLDDHWDAEDERQSQWMDDEMWDIADLMDQELVDSCPPRCSRTPLVQFGDFFRRAA